MNENWGFLNTEPLSAAMNMALDEALLLWNSQETIPPTLRFYSWKNPSLSLGYFQKMSSINLDGVKRHQCELVRRMTGGSAVLHDDELTYSIVISEKHPDIPSTIREAYIMLSKGILEGYRQLGIDVDYTTTFKNERDSAVCFEKPAFYELVYEGKKVSGNAQIRKKGTLLQHGSIPISLDVDLLFDLFAFPTESVKEHKKTQFYSKATSINNILNRDMTLDEVKDAFYEGFKKGLGINLKPIELTAEQWEEVKIITKKYEDLQHQAEVKKEGLI